MTWAYFVLIYVVITFFAGIALYIWKNYYNKPTFGECVIIGTLSVLLSIALVMLCVIGSIFIVIDTFLNFEKN